VIYEKLNKLASKDSRVAWTSFAVTERVEGRNENALAVN